MINFQYLDILDGEHFDAGHLVGGESTGFVGADDRGTTQSLDRGQGSDDGVLLGHAVRAQGQTGGDDSWETFGNGGDGQGDGDLNARYKANRILWYHTTLATLNNRSSLRFSTHYLSL